MAFEYNISTIVLLNEEPPSNVSLQPFTSLILETIIAYLQLAASPSEWSTGVRKKERKLGYIIVRSKA